MASCQQADQDPIDHILLADDNFCDFRTYAVELPYRLGDICFGEHFLIL